MNNIEEIEKKFLESLKAMMELPKEERYELIRNAKPSGLGEALAYNFDGTPYKGVN